MTEGHTETINVILDRGADIHLKDVQQRSPLARARKKDNQEITRLLQEHSAVE